jgi:hypothetical protein
MTNDKRKQYMDQYNKEKREFYKMCKIERIKLSNVQLVNENGEIISNTTGHNSRDGTYRYTRKEGHCRKCDRVFDKAGVGDGIICSVCLDIEINGTKEYYTKSKQYKLEHFGAF